MTSSMMMEEATHSPETVQEMEVKEVKEVKAGMEEMEAMEEREHRDKELKDRCPSLRAARNRRVSDWVNPKYHR